MTPTPQKSLIERAAQELKKLAEWQAQIVHGGRPFGEVADVMRDLIAEVKRLQEEKHGQTPRVDNELRLFESQHPPTEPAARINYLTKLSRRLEVELDQEKNLHGQAQAAAYEQNEIANAKDTTITQLRADLADARQIVRNMDQEAAMNREFSQKEFDSLRAELAACQNEAIKAAGERNRAKEEVSQWIDCFAIEGHISGDGSQHGPKESAVIWRQRIATLTEERDRALEDSARLDWLEKHENFIEVGHRDIRPTRASIDAARAQSGGQKT